MAEATNPAADAGRRQRQCAERRAQGDVIDMPAVMAMAGGGGYLPARPTR